LIRAVLMDVLDLHFKKLRNDIGSRTIYVVRDGITKGPGSEILLLRPRLLWANKQLTSNKEPVKQPSVDGDYQPPYAVT
jgi:hypothetical protein